ncbi:MAG: flagellar hook-basal body complex protein FliE [Syntrophaceae bacterium]|nr:flagellar hook-basal body complex protein FliE [Syntrophaceae bacterium]
MDTLMISSQRVIPQPTPRPAGQLSPAAGFSQALQKAVNDVSNLQGAASKAIQDVHIGQAESLHEAMIAMEKANVAFRTMLQVRNKALESYQEVMRMQV